FLVSCSAALRASHSFPTRRSSDLLVVTAVPGKLVHRDDLAAFPLEHREARGGKVAVLAIGQLADCRLDRLAILQRGSHRGRIVRSEEHTSELQSRENLVCRLLLEK